MLCFLGVRNQIFWSYLDDFSSFKDLTAMITSCEHPHHIIPITHGAVKWHSASGDTVPEGSWLCNATRERCWSFTQSFAFVMATHCEIRDSGQMFLRRTVAASHARWSWREVRTRADELFATRWARMSAFREQNNQQSIVSFNYNRQWCVPPY
jgi:hypothetical protein